jgi:hypothetical protein
MHASRAFVVVLVLVAFAFAPTLSTPLQCVVVPFISCDAADVFIVFVAPMNRVTERNISIVFAAAFNPKQVMAICFLFFWSFLGSG